MKLDPSGDTSAAWSWELPSIDPGRGWSGLVVLAAGVSWDDPWMSEKQLALALSKRVPVLYVDPPVSILTPLRKPHLRRAGLTSSVRFLMPGLARITPVSLPGVSRPVLRLVASAMTRRAIRKAARRLGTDVDTLVAASFNNVLGSCPARVRVLWGTDDWVAGAELMGLPTARLEQEETRQLASADIVLGVTETLAKRWQVPGRAVHVLPNGCDAQAFAGTRYREPAPDIELPSPIVGFVGHISERIDLEVLEAVAATGVSLLLVGPASLTSSLGGFEALVARPNVQWTGGRPFLALPHYLSAMTVGLTPYTSSAFNRSSYPLKTVEYLAAGLEVISSDLPAARTFPDGLIHLASNPAEFARLTSELMAAAPDEIGRAARQSFARRQTWDARAEELMAIVRHPRRVGA